MKRIISILLLVTLFSVYAFATAEDVQQETVSSSQFETLLMKKGSLLIKTFIASGRLPLSKDDSIYGALVEAATLTDVETGAKQQALKISHITRTGSSSAGVLDSSEIEDALATLQYIKEHIDEQERYTEIVYTASSGLVIGAYKSSETKLFIEYNSSDIAHYEISEIDEIVQVLTSAKEQLK